MCQLLLGVSVKARGEVIKSPGHYREAEKGDGKFNGRSEPRVPWEGHMVWLLPVSSFLFPSYCDVKSSTQSCLPTVVGYLYAHEDVWL